MATKGQVVMEFLLILGVALVIGMLYLAVSTNILADTSEQQRIQALNDVGFAVQDEAILAATVSDGYSRTFTIPQLADRFTYTISNDANSLTLQSGPAILTYDLPNITGTFVIGQNTIAKNGGIRVN